jgi:hypothetical protein
MTSLTIEMEVDYPKLYKFGYSGTNNIETVQNWQIGNNRFTNVLNGRKYLFAVHLRDPFATTLMSEVLVKCNCGLMIYSVTKTLVAGCELRINAVTKTLRAMEQTETDWSSGENTEQNDGTETDWNSGETTEQNDGPETDWNSGETILCSLKINSITKNLHI